jgi:spermidine/putrescine transport system substrate-binding protein
MKFGDDRKYERLLEAYGNGDISRRQLMGFLTVAAAAVGVVGGPFGKLTREALAAVDQVRFDGWGGIVSEAFHNYAFPPFTEKTGIKVVEGEFGDTDEFLTQVKASQPGEYNIFLVSGVYDYARFNKAGFGAWINEANIPNLQKILPATLDAFRNETEGKLSAGAKILWDEKYKGKMAMYDGWQTRAWLASIYTGQDPQGATDVDAMWDACRKQRELVVKYWGSGQEFIDLMSKEEVILSDGWSGRVAALREAGHDIGFVDTANAGFAWLEGLMVLAGSPMPECEMLLDFCSEPKVAIAIAEGQNYPPALDPNKVELPESVTSLPGFDPTGKFENFIWEEAGYWTKNQDAFKKQWERISKGA